MLAACILGLATCPFPFIAIGALSHFALAFSFVVLPPFLIGSGFLLWRYLRRPAATAGSIPVLATEVLSWVAIAVFLFFVSAINLQSTAERIGLSSQFFLLTSCIWLPWVFRRETALEARIKRLPKVASVVVLLVILAAAGSGVTAFFLAPPHLI